MMSISIQNKLELAVGNETTPNSHGLLSSVGNTPLLSLFRVGGYLPEKVQVFAKAEWFNPGGSVKDRPALNIIQTAIEQGDLVSGKRLLDSTSGNMGIAYATLGAAMDIGVTLAIPGNASVERIRILEALGAELILTDPLEGSDGAILVAREMAKEYPDLYWYADQYNNPANWQAHLHGTGPEIWEQTRGQLTHFVAGLGTSGTLTGITRYFKSINSNIKSIAMQPDSPFHGLEGLKHMGSSITPGIYDENISDQQISVRTEAAHIMTRRLAREEGLFVGISSGAAAVAALAVAEQLDEGVVVTVFPDAGYKYLSDEQLWRGAA